MPTPRTTASRARIAGRARELRRQITAIDVVAAGTLQVRTKTCGRPNCRCAKDPAARHGPYYEWARMIGGKMVRLLLNRAQADLVAAGIENRRAIEALLDQWAAETASEVLNAENAE